MKTNRLLLELLALITILPVLRANLHTAIPLFVFIIWFINSTNLTSASYVIKDPWGVSKWWLILIAYELFLSVIGFSETSPNNYLVRIPVYSIPMIMTFVLRKYSYKDQMHLFIFITAILLFTIVQNSYLHFRDPSFFNGFSLKEDKFKWTNWGTSGFVGCVLFMVPSCYLMWKTKTSRQIRWMTFLGFVLPFIYIAFINERATALILLLYYIVALIYVKHVKIENGVVFGILTAIVMVVGFTFVTPFLNWFSQVVDSEKLRLSLESVTVSIENSNIEEYEGSSLFGRYYLMQVSLGTWTRSIFTFLFGIGEDSLPAGSMGFISDLAELGIGQHSQIIDFLAMYGIVGTFMLLKAFHSTFSCLRSFAIDKAMVRELNVVFIGYILMSLLNNTLFTNELLVMFVLFAVAVNLYTKRTLGREPNI